MNRKSTGVVVIEAPKMTPRDWQDTRAFCLETIKEVYGIDYRAGWHQDLDDMLTSQNVYLPQNKGWFIAIRDENNKLVACAGLRSLATRPNLAERFLSRWPDPTSVGALWRSYVATDYRGQGLGTAMKQRRLAKAREMGYEHAYLHASKSNPVAIAFGKKFGFTEFAQDPDGTVHMFATLSGDMLH